jgi:sn-glycerol 3-phosphate transport system permease protein
MVERHPVFDFVSQAILLLGLVVALAPFAIVAIAASQDLRTVNQVPLPLVFGHDFLKNGSVAACRPRP